MVFITPKHDTELKFLREKVEQADYKLIPRKDPSQVKFQNWLLVKDNLLNLLVELLFFIQNG